jgi:hypothetical protein
MTALMFYVYD